MFDELNKSNNPRFNLPDYNNAEYVALCDTTTDVVKALEESLKKGLRPTIYSGGHCYEDLVRDNSGGIVIDLRRMSYVSFPYEQSKVCIGAGSTLAKVYIDLYRRTKTMIPGGTCPTVAMGGHTLGGGFGPLSRLYGLTVDWLTAIDIVIVDEASKVTARRIDCTNEPDLFRACRGAGGGNFGIVTNFYFDNLPLAPTSIVKGTLSFDWKGMTQDKFEHLVMLYGNYWETRGQDRATWCLYTVLRLTHYSSRTFRISFWFCSPAGPCRDLSVLTEFCAIFDQFHSTIDTESQYIERFTEAILDANIQQARPTEELARDAEMRYKHKSAYMKKNFSLAESACLYKYLTQPIEQVDIAGVVIMISSYGGAINNKELSYETVVSQRASVMKVQFIASWTKASEDHLQQEWLSMLYGDLYSTSNINHTYNGTPYPSPFHEGCYINYPDADMLRYSCWPYLYYGSGDIYPFLQAVKRKYDPNNTFRHLLSVRP